MAIATKDYGLFIGGETVEADETRDLQEPATGVALGRAAMASPTDVDRAVEAARAALEGPWAKTPPNERSRLIHALADAIAARPSATPVAGSCRSRVSSASTVSPPMKSP